MMEKCAGRGGGSGRLAAGRVRNRWEVIAGAGHGTASAIAESYRSDRHRNTARSSQGGRSLGD